jgi:hypothetical protein
MDSFGSTAFCASSVKNCIHGFSAEGSRFVSFKMISPLILAERNAQGKKQSAVSHAPVVISASSHIYRKSFKIFSGS